jgi:hypothetical protein
VPALEGHIPELTVIVALVVTSCALCRLGSAAADSIPDCRSVPTCQRCVAAAFPRPSSVT